MVEVADACVVAEVGLEGIGADALGAELRDEGGGF